MKTYIALLRGINVGGNNIIKMTDLKACFEDMGFTDVTTYIQSGNVIFKTDRAKNSLEKTIEQTLSKRFDYHANVVILSATELKKTIDKAPRGFGNKPKEYRYDVMFLKKPLTPAQVIKQVSVKDGVDTIYPGSGVAYFTRLISKATQSYLPKLIKLPIYKQMTIRNWNTTTKLLEKM